MVLGKAVVVRSLVCRGEADCETIDPGFDGMDVAVDVLSPDRFVVKDDAAESIMSVVLAGLGAALQSSNRLCTTNAPVSI